MDKLTYYLPLFVLYALYGRSGMLAGANCLNIDGVIVWKKD